MITDQNKLKPNNIQVPLYSSASYTLNMSHIIHHIVALDVLPVKKHISVTVMWIIILLIEINIHNFILMNIIKFYLE